MHEMGQAAARMLLSHFDGAPMPDAPEIIVTTLVVRGSSAPRSGSDVFVQAAASP
jgi:LacI family transcriptional regulator